MVPASISSIYFIFSLSFFLFHLIFPVKWIRPSTSTATIWYFTTCFTICIEMDRRNSPEAGSRNHHHESWSWFHLYLFGIIEPVLLLKLPLLLLLLLLLLFLLLLLLMLLLLLLLLPLLLLRQMLFVYTLNWIAIHKYLYYTTGENEIGETVSYLLPTSLPRG